MKAVEVKKAVAAVLALRNLKSQARRSREADDLILDSSEISSLVTAYQRERPLSLGSTMLH
ncbi:MAG TPA: hypothetical protein VJL90_15080 [Pseudorhodoplanes sp.]|nr:hypothetical protein [Pseudorhodoplanes sp.]